MAKPYVKYVWDGINWVNTQVYQGIKWVGNQLATGGRWIGEQASRGWNTVKSWFGGRSQVQGTWINVNEHMSQASRDFQTQITGQTGQAFLINGVRFDGVSAAGRLIEVKGSFSAFINQNTGQFHSWFRGGQGFIDQANRQLQAAGRVPIDWFFSDKASMNAVMKLFESANIRGINFIFQAPN